MLIRNILHIFLKLVIEPIYGQRISALARRWSPGDRLTTIRWKIQFALSQSDFSNMDNYLTINSLMTVKINPTMPTPVPTSHIIILLNRLSMSAWSFSNSLNFKIINIEH